jgi:sulfur-oxidizing protein SoxY
MAITRRTALAMAQGAAALAALGPGRATAGRAEAEALIARFTGGAATEAASFLTAPEVAENAGSTPIGIAVTSPMTEADHVRAVLLVAERNPNPGVAVFRFSPLSGRATIATRIRLAESQTLVAVAETSDGRFLMDRRDVIVTVGGCAG